MKNRRRHQDLKTHQDKSVQVPLVKHYRNFKTSLCRYIWLQGDYLVDYLVSGVTSGLHLAPTNIWKRVCAGTSGSKKVCAGTSGSKTVFAGTSGSKICAGTSGSISGRLSGFWSTYLGNKSVQVHLGLVKN